MRFGDLMHLATESLVRARLLSFGMILAIGFLLTVSLVVSATLATLMPTSSPIRCQRL